MDNENLQKLQSDLKAYAQTQYTIAKLRLVGGISKVLGYILLALTLILIGFAILAFVAFAAISALSLCMPTWAACLVIGGVYAILAIMAVIMRKKLFINPIVACLSGVLFASEKRKAEEERLRKEAEND